VNDHLIAHTNEAENELGTLVEDEQQQYIAYNHCFTDDV
jgi:Tat protein secretion system quality control protein TatD with DNase activity